MDEDVETTLEAAVLAALPVAWTQRLEDAVRPVMGDSFKRNELRRVINTLVDTDQVETVAGARGSVGYRLR